MSYFYLHKRREAIEWNIYAAVSSVRVLALEEKKWCVKQSECEFTPTTWGPSIHAVNKVSVPVTWRRSLVLNPGWIMHPTANLLRVWCILNVRRLSYHCTSTTHTHTNIGVSLWVGGVHTPDKCERAVMRSRDLIRLLGCIRSLHHLCGDACVFLFNDNVTCFK